MPDGRLEEWGEGVAGPGWVTTDSIGAALTRSASGALFYAITEGGARSTN